MMTILQINIINITTITIIINIIIITIMTDTTIITVINNITITFTTRPSPSHALHRCGAVQSALCCHRPCEGGRRTAVTTGCRQLDLQRAATGVGELVNSAGSRRSSAKNAKYRNS